MSSQHLPFPGKWVASLLGALTLLSPGSVTRAEMAPEVYAGMQRQAPECVRVEVLSVHTVRTVYPDYTDVAVTVVARVRAVERSASGLRPGQRIRIRYDRREHRQPIAGPSAVPILEPGKVYPAFLEKQVDGPSYLPAAGGYSFEVIRSKAK